MEPNPEGFGRIFRVAGIAESIGDLADFVTMTDILYTSPQLLAKPTASWHEMWYA